MNKMPIKYNPLVNNVLRLGQRTGHCPAFPTFRAMAKKSAESLEVSKFLCTFATENYKYSKKQ